MHTMVAVDGMLAVRTGLVGVAWHALLAAGCVLQPAKAVMDVRVIIYASAHTLAQCMCFEQRVFRRLGNLLDVYMTC